VTAFINCSARWAHLHGREQARTHAEGACGARGPRGAFRVKREPRRVKMLYATERGPRFRM
jgi:hypothetical protein